MSISQDHLSQIPKKPGVYLFKDQNNTILYIGKAKILFNRIRSYFNKNKDIKTEHLVKKIAGIETIVTNNEVEALLLENNLIKEHLPKYNIRLKDAKSFPYIKITSENLPRVIFCREKINRKDEYFGPFVDSQKIREVISIIRKFYKIRSCNRYFTPPYHDKPCLSYYIKRCDAPCAGFISENDYLSQIQQVRQILKGNIAPLIQELTRKMKIYSENEEFEKAALVRNQIQSLEELNKKQLVQMNRDTDIDIVGSYNDFSNASISILKIRDGKIIDKENFLITKILSSDQFLTDFLNIYYLNITQYPSRILLAGASDEDTSVLKQALYERSGVKIQFSEPSTSQEKKLLSLSRQNAEFYFEETQLKIQKIHHLRELKQVLKLKNLPRIIECFDIATLSGKYNTASMVTFHEGKPDKINYRQFNIEGEGHPDDYAMMEEVIARRYQKLKNEKLPMPDLIVVDGGRGQLNAALKSLDILNLDIDIIGLAKKEELIYQRNNSKPLQLSRDSYALKMLQAIRDESHRFSNVRLSVRYKNDLLKSKLSQIEGIGEKKLILLLKHFKSLKRIKNATIEELTQVESIGENLAKKIHDHLHQ